MNRALHSFSSHTCERLFEVDFKRVTVSCVFNRGHHKASNFKPLKPYSRIKSHINRSYSTFSFHSLYQRSSRDNMLPLNSISHGIFYPPVFSTRLFSQTPGATLVKSAAGDAEIKAKGASFLSFNKHWTQSKKLAHKKRLGGDGNTHVKSSLKAVAKDDIVTLKDPHVEDSKKGQVANSKPKKKRQPKVNKSPEKATVASEEPTPQASSSSRSVSRSKKSKSSKNDLQAAASEASANGKPAVEVSLEDEQPKGATKKINKRKPKALTKSKEAVQISHVTESPSNLQTGTSVKNKTLEPLYPPTGKSVVVVESLTKAKVIQGYLGDMFEVLPSYGHVRDLAARSGSVRPDEDFSMVWEVPSAAWTHLKSIKVALTGTKNLILASDPDREGEAIAWHIIEMLQQQNALPESINVARVVFNEITESSIKQALQSPRDIDFNLVQAYLARRALDYLIGFNISPLLWRKLPGCQSAGRVQSVALALICDRETDIDKFKPQEYWTIEGEFNIKNSSCMSHLTHYDSKKLNQMSIASRVEANDIENTINLSEFNVIGSSKKNYKKTSLPPYITSTLQQESASKLHFPSSYTMKLAQKLYEGVKLPNGESAGLITYMRTDGLHMSETAVEEIRSFVKQRYGPNYIPSNARKFFKKVKNAQEAHEAIRPTDITRLPSMLSGILDEDSLKLYTLIWARAVSCQMEPSVTEQIQVDIGNANASIIFRTTCSRKDFLGFQAVYKDIETKIIKNDEDQENEDNEHNMLFNALNSLKIGDRMSFEKLELKEHHTQHPPRYSEGSLVKKMEELGIGRPSTYASTIKVLKDRNYVTLKNRVLYPEFRGRMVSVFLFNHFSEVTDYSFTADMETELDNVSGGITEWKGLLRDYWTRFSKYCEKAGNVHIHQVEKMLEKTFGDFLFASLPDQSRTCPSCGEGTLIFKVSRFGAGYFIGCDQHPHCKYIAKTLYGEEEDDPSSPENGRAVEEPKLLGLHPVSKEKVLLKNGPYGHYVQLGEDKRGHLPKRASVAQISDLSLVTMEYALKMLRYPITLGKHPADGQPVVLKLARHGLSVKHRRTQAPVPKNVDADDVTLEKALECLNGPDAKKTGRPKKNEDAEAVEIL